MVEKAVIVGLLSSRIETFKGIVLESVNAFYEAYNPVKSLDRSYIFNLLTTVDHWLDHVESEIKDEGFWYGKEDNC